MTANEIGQFIGKIIEVLDRNGFPEQRVSLPLEQMYEKAYEKGFSFNKVLDFLKEKGIEHEKTTDKIIFFSATEVKSVEEAPAATDPGPGAAAGFNFSDAMASMGLAGKSLPEMMKKASELMSQLSPDQLKSVQDMVTNMSPEQKDELLKKAKDSGLGL